MAEQEMRQDQKDPESVWKRLTRLFRSGPVIRHKIAAGEHYSEPQGTARAYKKEISSLYVHSLASYGQYERLCISMDELVFSPTSRGVMTLRELVECYPNGEKFIVYAYDHERQKIVPAWAHHPRSSGMRETVRVVLDDGTFIVATPDHPFMVRDGTYVNAGELQSGQSLMPFYRKEFDGTAKDGKKFKGYRSIYTMEKQPKSWKGWEAEHRLIAEWFYGREVKKHEEHVHHIDHDPRNNVPENLRIVDAREHLAEHGRQATEQWADPQKRATIQIAIQRAWDEDDGSRVASVARSNAKCKLRKDITFEHVCLAASKSDYYFKGVCARLDCSASVVFRMIHQAGYDVGNSWDKFVFEHFGIKLEQDRSAFATCWFGKKRPQEWKDSRKESGNPIWRVDLTLDRIVESARKNGFVSKDVCVDLGCQNKILLNRIRRAGFSGWRDLVKKVQSDGQAVFNHKVVSVEPNGVAEVGDLTVDGFENFCAGSDPHSGVVIHNSRYADYSEMEFTPEIASALDIYADEVTAKNEHGEVLQITTKNQEIKKVLETLFYDVLNVEFNIWSWVRNLVKYGDFVLFVDASEENGILNMLPIPINEIEREEGYDKKDPFAVRFRWLTQGNMILENWQIIHIRMLGNDNFLPYGSSLVEPARRIWRQLILIEDAMLVYRIIRSPERRVFKIDVGNVPPDQVEAYIEKVKTALKRQTIIDPSTGRVDLRYNPLPVRRDTLVPLLDGRTITIEELAREHELGKENWVYSVQDGTKRLVPGKVVWAGRNYTCDKIHRVWLDDGSHVDTAPEHPFVLRDGSSKRADELASGDSLMAVYRDVNNMGYERCVDPSDGKRIATHAMVARDVYREKWEATDGRVVHHKHPEMGPSNKRNNSPGNLDVMNFWEHRKMHTEHCELTLNRPEQLEARRETRIAYNKTPEKRARTSEQNKLYQKAQKMGAAYNGSELHKSHNENRRQGQLKSWGEDKHARSEAMQWIIPSEVLQIVFDRVRSEPDVTRNRLWDFVSGSIELREIVRTANAGVNARDPDKFHFVAIKGKLERMGELMPGSTFAQFREYAVSHPVPLNHQVVRVEVLDEIDDVYCMTVVGPMEEHDRHSFAVVSEENAAKPKSLVFLRNSVDEDYFIPVRGDRSSDISTLAGGQFPVRQDTPVPLLDGRVLTIAQLAAEYESGRENWVHSVQEGTNAFVPGKVIWCGKNYTCDQIHRVWLDDGTYADMAPEHPIVMRDGTKKRVDQVQPGESVMPFRTDRKKIGKYNYTTVLDPADDEMKFVHRLVAGKHGISEAMRRSKESSVVLHHVDFNRFNNRPDNLRWLGRLEHVRLHGENARRNLHTPEMDEKNRRRMTEYNRSGKGCAATILRNIRRWDSPQFRKDHSGINHWLARKWDRVWEQHTLDELQSFCQGRGITSFNGLLEQPDRFYKSANQFRLFLQHHGVQKWTDFAYERLSVRPRNHTVARVEVLEGVSDDVYCMTVVGPSGEDDRHNFAAATRRVDRSVDLSNNGLYLGNTGDIDDVQYIQNKVFAALKIPKAYLSYAEGDGSKASLAQQDVRFARTIDRVQKIVVAELSKVAIIHLYLMGYRGEDLVDFELKLANSSIIAEQQYLELWRTRLEIAGTAQEGVFDREFIWKRIFKLSDEEIDQIREGKKFDKIEDLYLEQVQLPGVEGMPAGEEGGEGELPDTLGGPPPGGAPPEGGAGGPPEGAPPLPPENAGVDRGGEVVGERTNPGSTDPIGNKQSPFRRTEDPAKLASATPQFHNARHGHKPSARDPMKVFKRVARGHVSAEDIRGHVSDATHQRLNEVADRIRDIYEEPRMTASDLMIREIEEVEVLALKIIRENCDFKKKA